MARSYKPKYKFVLTDKRTGLFPKVDDSLISGKGLTSFLDETYIFDDRDNESVKIGYYNGLYSGIAEFEVFSI